LSEVPDIPGDGHRVLCHIDELLTQRDMTQTELAQRMGLSLVNLSILKNNRARAIRFSTLTALCDALQCQPGDLFTVLDAESQAHALSTGAQP
jgi:putative transcriptional regulator